MIKKRQQAYLKAMNIPVWVARHQPEMDVNTSPEVTCLEAKASLQGMQAHQSDTGVRKQPATNTVTDQTPPAEAIIADQKQAEKASFQGLKLGPGAGGSLLVCSRDSDSASKLSNDIARSLPKNPVWGWPDNNASGVAPVEAVNENLFTCVAVFGDALAQLLFGNQVPAALGSAKLVILPAMSELESSAEARQQLWSELCRCGMVVA